MFVSSFNTYISDVNLKKARQNTQKAKDAEKFDFSLNLQKNQQVLTSTFDAKTPINYISNYKSFANKQKLQDKQLTKKPIDKFSKINKMQNAKTSYEVNSKKFSLLRVPHITLNQVQKSEEKLPIKLQQKMVNTYIDNENYYKITA
ncbi:MAG: hypothetical protein ABGW74_04305 [Campylobacterales bacterium]